MKKAHALASFLLHTDHRLIALGRKYVVFIFGGGIGTVLAIVVTFLLTEYMDFWQLPLWYWYSYAAGITAATLFAFVYHRHVTFNKKSKWKSRFARFSVFVIFLALANWLLVRFVTERFGIHYVIAIFLVTFALSVVNYFVNRIWIFRA